MSKRVQLRRGTTAETNTFTGAEGEVTVDTTKNTLVVHDGVTAGGHPLMNEISYGVGNGRLNVTSSRVLGTTYTNTSGTLKMVNVRVQLVSTNAVAKLSEGVSEIDYVSAASNGQVLTLSGIILPEKTYSVTSVGGTVTIQQWVETV